MPGEATAAVDGIPLPEDEPGLDSVVAPAEVLALPWRRFDKDLRGEGEEGLRVCGSRVAIRDVSNSSEGTGLFTWVSTEALLFRGRYSSSDERFSLCEQISFEAGNMFTKGTAVVEESFAVLSTKFSFEEYASGSRPTV